MKYTKANAQQYAKQHFTGVWAASVTPFRPDGSFDEEGFRSNIAHWIGPLKVAGLFVTGKQGEAFSMTLEERKRSFEIAAQVCEGRARTVMSCSDTQLDTVLDLARHAQAVGADWVIVHSPVLHFCNDPEETVYEYYRHLCEVLDIGIAMWNHPDCGYIMSPQLCARIAALPNIVAIKYSVPREQYAELTRLVGDKIQVSTASEEEWLDNIIELGWRLYLCSTPPLLLQTASDTRIHDYTQLAFQGRHEEARAVRDSLNPARQAFRNSRPSGTPQAHTKYWLELLGQAGGPVRRPLLGLTEAEKAHARKAFAESGLRLP
ncbi:dihydrodipicolinate synthase family protein [Variovorax paradoxus]|uniref:dihydrodipicolinate synthase family protein n=1 Tax=Variovorax paradoxus TaxID=34073 RepID=UPI002787D7CB|nr:dihydrodipicolinate synthase family protein [Variovorax paradoxus]MDP9932803.1 4-hydroxy-tetrahydrodipicolinate synthase [Variovorax paradoxus]